MRPAPDVGAVLAALPALARRYELAALGACRPTRLTGAERRLRRWLADGCHGAMSYLDNPAVRADPRATAPWARGVLVAALAHPRYPDPSPPGAGRVAAYARGADYHRVLGDRLRALAEELPALAGRPVRAAAWVDAGPLLERELARRAGIGFVGKSTMVIVPGVGSDVLLGLLLVDLPLPAARPLRSRCGACRRCLDACPTAALSPFRLDARRCLSYLTIEHRGAIAPALRYALGTWVCGCDLCQTACPFNRARRARPVPAALAPRPELDAPDLQALLTLRAGAYRRLTRGTALTRLGRNLLARNAAVALGNAGDRRAVGALVRALGRHPSLTVREHAAWALGRLGGVRARQALLAAERRPLPASLRAEVRAALAALARD